MNSIKTFFKLTGVMILLQGVRAAIFAAGFTLFQNQIAGVYQRLLSGIAIAITAVFFILVFRPDFARIGFSLKGRPRAWKIAVPILCGLWEALILSSLALSEDGSPNFGLLL